MRKILMLAASLIFIGAGAANAQNASPQPPPATAPDVAPKIQRFNVVDVSELPQETQKQVERIVAQGNDATLKELHSTIEATPEAKAALDAKGATSGEVVATAMGTDGTLTLITKKKG